MIGRLYRVTIGCDAGCYVRLLAVIGSTAVVRFQSGRRAAYSLSFDLVPFDGMARR